MQLFYTVKVPVLFEDNSYLFVITLAKLMHLLLTPKFGNLIPKFFFVVIRNLKSKFFKQKKSFAALNIPNLKSKENYTV